MGLTKPKLGDMKILIDIRMGITQNAQHFLCLFFGTDVEMSGYLEGDRHGRPALELTVMSGMWGLISQVTIT